MVIQQLNGNSTKDVVTLLFHLEVKHLFQTCYKVTNKLRNKDNRCGDLLQKKLPVYDGRDFDKRVVSYTFTN